MIRLKSREEIEVLKEAGKKLADIMRRSKKFAKPGVSSQDVEDFFVSEIKKLGDKPAFLNYTPAGSNRPFPACVCVSINNEIVHGIPNEIPKIFKEGDIVTFDAGLIHKGLFVDHAITYSIGKISKEAQKLMSVTKEALMAGIKEAKIGNKIGDISARIEKHAQKAGFAVVEGLAGHGVGYSIHEDPFVPNEGRKGKGELIEEGLVIAIEPMFSTGSSKIKLGKDGYTFLTADGSLSAQFEHTVAVTKDGPIILTK
jgi:methionyl aminopeptidase